MTSDGQRPDGKREPAPPRGEVRIMKARCKGCGFCIEFCPRDVLSASEEFNAKGYHYPEVTRMVCTNCHLCEMICPDYAIYSVENPAAAAKNATGSATPGENES